MAGNLGNGLNWLYVLDRRDDLNDFPCSSGVTVCVRIGEFGGQVLRDRCSGHIWSTETSAEHMKQHNTTDAELKVMYDLRFDSVARYCL